MGIFTTHKNRQFCAINSTEVEIKFNQAVSTKTGVNGLENFYFALTENTVVGSDLATLNPTGYTAEFARDLVLADGKLADTVEGSLIAKDTVRPEISKVKEIRKDLNNIEVLTE